MIQESPICSWPFGSRPHETQTVPSQNKYTYRHYPNLYFLQLKNLQVSKRNTSLYHSLPNISFKSALGYKKLCCSSYPQISVHFAAHPSLLLYHFFLFKDRIPFSPISHVVHCLKCRSCESSYIGETVWCIHVRISDRMEISALIGKKRLNPPLLPVFSYITTLVILFPSRILKFFHTMPFSPDSCYGKVCKFKPLPNGNTGPTLLYRF